MCNLKCSKCLHHNKNFPRKKGFLSKENLKIILNKLPDSIEYIGLGGIGENFMHPNFFELLDICKEHNKNYLIGFHSNGTLLDENIIRKIIERDINDISFSIDASNNETYKKVHDCNHDLQLVLGKIKKLIDIKNSNHSKLKINLSFVIQKENIGELGNFIMIANNLGVDSIGPINLVTPIHGYDFSYWKDPISDIKNEIKSAKYIIDKYNLKIKLPNINEKKAGSANIDHINGFSCAFPFSLYPIITWDGFVFPCVWLHDIERLSIGNIIHANTFEDIWEGEKIKKIRNIFSNGNYLYECSKCKPGNLSYKEMNFVKI